MRLRLPPRPDPDVLREAPLHVVVRTYPETLTVLREAGVDPAAGGRPLAAEEGDESGGLMDRLLEATSWRPPDRDEGT